MNLIHDVDLLRHFCGEIESVQAMAVPSRRGYDNEELASALLRFTSGALATVTVSDSAVSPWSWEFTAEENPVYHPTGQSCYAISGSEGALSVPDLRLWRHQGQPDWWNPLTAEQRAHDGSDSLVNQLGALSTACCEGQEAPLVGGREGTAVLAGDRSHPRSRPTPARGLPSILASTGSRKSGGHQQQQNGGLAPTGTRTHEH